MPLRNDAEFAFPERVLGPVQEHRRIISGGAWGEDVFAGGHRAAFVPSPNRFQKMGGMMTPPPYTEEYDFEYSNNYDYDYEEDSMMDFVPPPPPPHVMRRPMGGPIVQRGGYSFKSVGPVGFEETTTRFHTPPPPALVEGFRRSPIPSPRPFVEEVSVFRNSPPPPPAMVGRRASRAMAVRGGYMGGEVISEEISIRPIGFEVWEEQIEVPVVTPIMQTVVRQDPMIVEKRITQETVAPMVVQETGMAAAATVVESATVAPTIIQEMGTAPPTVVQEMGMVAPPTVVQEGYAGAAAVTTHTGYVEPRMVSEWETRTPTVVREMDATLPPIAAGQTPGFMGLEPAPVATTTTTSMRPQLTINTNYVPSTFEQGMVMPGGIGAAPMNAVARPAAVAEPKARGLKRLFKRH